MSELLENVWQDTERLPVTDLAKLLADARKLFRQFVVLDDVQADTVALWIAHTYVFDTARATPYLHFWSPDSGSGKTTAFEVLELLARAGLIADDLTGAALFRLVEARRPTLLVDEVDGIFGKKNSDSTEDIRKILNSGYRAGKKVFRCGGRNNTELQEFDPYCPKALAGLNEIPGTLAHRSIPIAMKPPLPTEQYEDFDVEMVEEETASLRARFEAWAESAEEALRNPELRPAKLPALDARRNEIWRILFRIADLAGHRWPEAARRAALELSGGERRHEEASLGIKLLADVRQVFVDERMPCQEIADALNGLEDSWWGSWSDGAGIKTRELGKRLVHYGVRAKRMRIDEWRGYGYERSQFEDVWSRYLPVDGDLDPDNGTTAWILGLKPIIQPGH
jgi:hypothetical protein